MLTIKIFLLKFRHAEFYRKELYKLPTLNWLGKDKVVTYHQKVPYHFLDKKFSIGNSENAIIHGDNLIALKSLLPRYENKIKCIYIDPPYNTGNENWIYNDNVSDSRLQKWIGEVVGKEGEDLTRHDKWLCMMYPRLRLLQKLLSDDGAIFISIDDNELFSLKFICDEIFGASNFVGNITLVANLSGRDYGGIARMHEYILVYRKSPLLKLNLINDEEGKFKMFDKLGGFELRELRNRNVRFNDGNRPNLYYPFYVDIETADENGLHKISLEPKENWLELFPLESQGIKTVWRWGKEKAAANLNVNIMAKPMKNNRYMIVEKYREEKKMARSVWNEKEFRNEAGTLLLKEIFGGKVFDYPKSLETLSRIVEMATDKNSIVLDSFAGSGTTAHAVINLNAADGGNRKFILIELNDYAENITAERVKRVGGSFDFYEIGESLFDDDGFINSEVPFEKIFEYIYYSETRKNYVSTAEENLMGVDDDTAYYYFGGENLSWTTLAKIKTRAKSYVIYADACNLSEDELVKYKIKFKKIPEDILGYGGENQWS